jgi:hypothetical protein
MPAGIPQLKGMLAELQATGLLVTLLLAGVAALALLAQMQHLPL